jgi:hypothetical protein
MGFQSGAKNRYRRSGRLAATGNARSLNVSKLVGRTISAIVDEERCRSANLKKSLAAHGTTV